MKLLLVLLSQSLMPLLAGQLVCLNTIARDQNYLIGMNERISNNFIENYFNQMKKYIKRERKTIKPRRIFIDTSIDSSINLLSLYSKNQYFLNQ